jgi:hypothetical protein
VFGWTKAPLMSYLLETWSENIATFLTYSFAGVEAYLIYGTTKLLFTSLVIWSFAALAARRFPGV